MGVTSVYMEGNPHLGKNKTPQSKKVHGGSSFKGVHLKNSSTVRPNYSWGTEPSFHSPEKSQCTNMLKVKQLDCFCGTSLRRVKRIPGVNLRYALKHSEILCKKYCHNLHNTLCSSHKPTTQDHCCLITGISPRYTGKVHLKRRKITFLLTRLLPKWQKLQKAVLQVFLQSQLWNALLLTCDCAQTPFLIEVTQLILRTKQQHGSSCNTAFTGTTP